MNPERKPLAPAMESRLSFNVKLKPSEIEAIKIRALCKGMGHTTLAREYLLMGMSMDDAQELRKGHARVTA